jgi:membrane associated rhomboid family serine protease
MTIALVILNLAVFLFETAAPQPFLDLFALWPPAQASAQGAPPFHVWQLLTYSVLHANFTHIAFNMFGLYIFGRDVEDVVGHARLLLLYVASVVAGGIVQIAVLLASSPMGYPTIGASAGVFGLLVSYAVLFPQRRVILLFPPIPMPAWLFATGYAALELLLGVSGNASGVAHFAHLGGMLGAIACLLVWSRHSTRAQ